MLLHRHTGLLLITCAITTCAGLACSPAKAPSRSVLRSDVLPLKTVRLYETGVGYFERQGNLSSPNGVSLPVPAGHLDDALKTLIVITGKEKARVNGFEFASRITPGLARKLAGLPSVADEPITYRALLASLAGAHVFVRVRRPVTAPPRDKSSKKDDDTTAAGHVHYERLKFRGRLVDVIEEAGLDDTEAKRKELVVLLMTDKGELRRIRAQHLDAVRPTNKALAARIDAALDALTSRASQRRQDINVLGSSNGRVTLGYVAETPIWRSSYRLMLQPTGNRAKLQGWSLIHNDTDEAWKSITVELVNGQPDSFLFPLAAPRYGRRPLAEPAEQLSTAPQLMEKTPDQIWGDHFDADGGGTGTGQGFGSGYGRMGRSHRARAPRVRMGSASVSESTALSVGNLADIAPADGVEAGALFSYRLAAPVDLRPHGSAMLPFLSGSVDVRRLTLFNARDEAGRAAVRVNNTTKQTLPAGPVTVYEGGGFAGETGVERLKPGQRTFVAFAVDLDADVSSVHDEQKEKTQHVTLDDDERLQIEILRTTRWKLKLESRSGSQRLVYIKLNLVNNAKVTGADEMDYDTASRTPYAVFKLKPGQKLVRELTMVEGIRRTEPISHIEATELDELSKLTNLPAADRALLVEAAKQVRERDKQGKQMKELEQRRDRLNDDLERLRGHLKALGPMEGRSSGQVVQRVLRAEDELTAVLDKLTAGKKDQAAKLTAIKTLLKPLSPVPTPSAPSAKP